MTCHATAPLWILSVFGLDPENPIAAVETVPVWAEAGVLGPSTALRISRAVSIDYVLVAHPIEEIQSAWRVAELQTDAHLMFCRLNEQRQVSRVAIVDGSSFRAAGRQPLCLALPRRVPDLHVDVAGVAASATARLSGPGYGARVVIGRQVMPIAMERRASRRIV